MKPIAPALIKGVVVAGLIAPALGGCAYDYLQHSDQISPHAGNAVAANIAQSTINPSSASMYNTKGLGADGSAIEGNNGSAGTSSGGSATQTSSP